MRLIPFILRNVFNLLYHQFAWAYDLVAAVVSLGHWNDWVHSVLPHLDGRILEIGFGPGHLQLTLCKKGLAVFGLDESLQMARQSSRRLLKEGFSSNRLVRGLAQHLPYSEKSFDTVIATFPSEYIFDVQTLNEIHRALAPHGKFILLPMAWITGRHLWERLAAWPFRIAGGTPGMAGSISVEMKNRLACAGFNVHSEMVNLENSSVLVIIANRSLKVGGHLE